MPTIVSAPPEIEAKIIEVYRKSDLTLRAIGARYGVSHQTASNILRRAGIENRALPRPSKWHRYADEIRRLYVEENLPMVKIAAMLSLGTAGVARALRAGGIKIKNGGERDIVYPELRKLKNGESIELPRVGGSERSTYTRYYMMAKTAGIKVSVRVIDDDYVRVTRKA